MVRKDRVSNPYCQGGSGAGTTFERSKYTTCENKHLGKCLADRHECFGFGSKGHNMRDFPTVKAKGKVAMKLFMMAPIAMLKRRTVSMCYKLTKDLTENKDHDELSSHLVIFIYT